MLVITTTLNPKSTLSKFKWCYTICWKDKISFWNWMNKIVKWTLKYIWKALILIKDSEKILNLLKCVCVCPLVSSKNLKLNLKRYTMVWERCSKYCLINWIEFIKFIKFLKSILTLFKINCFNFEKLLSFFKSPKTVLS